MQTFFSLAIFLFGLVVGSFLNCIIYRLQIGEGFLRGSPRRKAPKENKFPTGQASFLRGRSFCPRCGHTLSWDDLIPIFSFLILRGRCKYCQKPISWQYPIVETATGLLFLLIFNFFTPTPNFGVGASFSISNFQFLTFLYYLLISCFLIIIFVYDLKHYIIPDQVIYPAIATAFVYRLFEFLSFNNWDLFRNWKLEIENLQPLLNSLLSAIIASAFFLLIVLVSRGRWMGVGDIKLAFFMGLFLGWPNISVALFLAFLIGAIIGIGLILIGKKTMKSEVPFGPFLVTGTFLAMFFGCGLISWYLTLFLV